MLLRGREIRRMKKHGRRLEIQNIGYLFIAPNFLIYVVFVFIPIFYTIGLSFTDYNLKTANFTGVANYINLFKDDVFLIALKNTLYYTVMFLPAVMVLGLALAMLINTWFYGRAVFRAVFYLPQVVSLVASSLAWMYLYGTNGIINLFFRGLGVPAVGWLTDSRAAMPSIVIMSLWQGGGYSMLLFLSGLQSIPVHLYEAATIDGAGRVQTFFNVTIPQLAPTTFFVFVMTCIQSFQIFGQVYMMTGGGPNNATTTLAHQVYTNGFQYYKMGYGSSMAFVLLLIILCVTLINFKFGNVEGDES
jgi:multiple sugar transport system permease protein/raffinose/stachyose/melibiose transport system permease protein